MALPLMYQKKVLASKVESVYGTAETLAAADAGFRAIEPKFKINGETIQRERQGGLGVDLSIGGASLSTELNFKLHLAGKGATAAVPAWATTFLPACGFALSTGTFAASSDSSTWKGVTSGMFIDGRRYLGRGLMFNGKITLEAGKPGMIEFDGKGGWAQDPDDTAILSGMTYETALPPIWAGTGSLALASGALFTKVQKVEIDFGCDVQLREDPNAPGGVLGGWIANRISKINFDPEATAFVTKNWWADSRANTLTAFSAVLGTSTYNTMTIGASLQVDGQPDYDSRGGKLVDKPNFLVNADSLNMLFT